MAANPSIQLGTDGNWAIKEDNLLAYKKDGTRFFNKEFDFTRGSLATFVDKDGFIKVSGVTDTELVTNGNFDNNSDWSNFSTPTTSKQSTDKAYLGNYSWYIVASAFRQGIFSPNNFSLVSGKTYRASLWIYALDGAEIISGVSNSDASVFTSRTVVQGQWTNIVYYFTATASSASYISILSSSSTLKFYVDNVSVKEIQTDVPRIDFTDDTTGHLLLEPQSTNKLTYSEDFSQWSNTGVTITPNESISPDGNLNATKVIGDGTNGIYKQESGATGLISRSIYIKSVVGNVNVILKDPTLTVTSKSVLVTENWQRFELVENNGHGSSSGIWVDDIPSSGIYMWGAQLEEESYPTSYIPTYGSAATRIADICNNSGSAQDFNSEEGVLYCEAATLVDPTGIMIIGLSDGTVANRISITFHSTLNRLQVFSQKNSSQLFNIDTTSISKTNFNRIAISYSIASAKLFVNGTLAASATPSDMFNANTLNRVNFDIGSGANDFYGKTKNLKVFKRAMSNGELYLLTVPQYQSYQEMATALNYTL